MKLHFYSIAVLLSCLAAASPLDAQITLIDFEDLGLPLDTAVTADAATVNRDFIFSDVVTAPSRYDTSFGGFWAGGWAVSTSRDDSTGTFFNLTGAVTGGGANGTSTYLVGQNGAELLLPAGTEVLGWSYTNLTYTAEVLREGSFFSRPFGIDTNGVAGVADSLVVSVNFSTNGQIDATRTFALADFRGPDQTDTILQNWARVDLSEPGTTSSNLFAERLAFVMQSSDRNAAGQNNTPDFFAIDELALRVDPNSTRRLLAASEVRAYPNPTAGSLWLEDTGRQLPNMLDVFVLDATGRVMATHFAHASNTPLDLSTLPAGQYVLSLVSPGYRAALPVVLR